MTGDQKLGLSRQQFRLMLEALQGHHGPTLFTHGQQVHLTSTEIKS